MEAASKNRRGRPTGSVGELAKVIGGIVAPDGCERLKINRAYEQHAVGLLGDCKNNILLHPEFQWFSLPRGKLRHGLLEQIGRLRVLGGDVIALMAARKLCEDKPKTKDAEAWLRAVRQNVRADKAGET